MLTSVDLLKKLKEQHDKSAVSVLVGAGFSKNAIQNYPDWDFLLRDLVQEIYGQQIQEKYDLYRSGHGPFYLTEERFEEKEIDTIIHNEGYLNLVSKYIEMKGYREAIDVYIEEHIPFVKESGDAFEVTNMPDIPFTADNLNVHKELLLCKWKQIYTTNYDNLLELTNNHYKLDYKKITRDYELSDLSEKRGIIKVHGDLIGDSLDSSYEFDNDKSRRYIISADDYATYADKHQAFSYQMKTGLLTGVFCLIGFSGNDPNFLGWLEWMKDVLDRDSSDPDKENTKVFLLTIGQQEIEKSRQLFYQNHHIGIINIMDDDVLTEIGMNLLIEKTVGNVFTLLFRYLLEGSSDMSGGIESGSKALNLYQKLWREIDTNNITAENAKEMRRLKPYVLMPTSVTLQHMALSNLYRKKEWTEHDAVVFAIGCVDSGLIYTNLRSEEKEALLESVNEWQQWKQLYNVLLQENPIQVDDANLQPYLQIMSCWYNLEPEGIKEIADNWNVSDNWEYGKAAGLFAIDEEQAINLIDRFITNSKDQDKRYLASLLGNVVLTKMPAKYSYNEFKVNGVKSFFDIKDALMKGVRYEKIQVKPYGWKGREFGFSRRSTDIEEAFRLIVYLLLTGMPIQYKGHSLISNEDWYEVFSRIFEFVPYPTLFYSQQLHDKNTLQRIGQDYAYSYQLADELPKILKKLLRVVKEDVPAINDDACLRIASELLCALPDELWFDDAVTIFEKEVLPQGAMLSSQSGLNAFAYSVINHLQSCEHVSAFVDVLLQHFDTATYLYSDFIYHLPMVEDYTLTDSQMKNLQRIFEQHPINKTYLLAASLLSRGLLNESLCEQVRKRIVNHPEEVFNAKISELHSITWCTNKNDEAIAIVKQAILNKNIWNSGIRGDGSATAPSYLALNKISKDIVWTNEEITAIIDNLEENLGLMNGWGGLTDSFFGKDYSELLSDMLEFVEHVCIHEMGLEEYKPLLVDIKEVQEKALGLSDVFNMVFDHESDIDDVLEQLARCIDFYGVEKYRIYIDAVLDRALLMVKPSLRLSIDFVRYMVEKHNEYLDSPEISHKLILLLDKYREVDYSPLDLKLSLACISLNSIAKRLKGNSTIDAFIINYWLEDKKVTRFH